MTAPAPDWHAISRTESLSRLDSSPRGLTDAEARERLVRFGPNALAPPPPEPVAGILLRQFRNVVVALLAAAGLVAIVNGDVADAAAIAAVLAINVTLGFVTELRARRAMRALRRLEVPRASVLRDGHPREIDARTLVPGDVITLEAGASVPADARLLEANELRTNESSLTGESLPAGKRAAVRLPADQPFAERANMVFSASDVVAGSGRAVVVSTGSRTEVGRVGVLLGSVPEERTPMEERLDSLGRRLAAAAISAGVLIGAVSWFRGARLQGVLEMAFAVAVAAVPEGLPAVVTVAMAIGVRRMARRKALVRRLSVVESLGAATVICTDKTGTLTTGEQTVTTLWVPDRFVGVTGIGFGEDGGFLEGAADGGGQAAPPAARAIDVRHDAALRLALQTGLLANSGGLERTDGGWRPIGDPTDVALVVAALKAALDRESLLRERPAIGEVPFSSARMLMATFHRMPDGGIRAYTKGAARRVLDRCAHVNAAAGAEPLTAAWRSRIDAAAAALGSRGLRVLGLATGVVDDPSIQGLRNLTFVGLAGMTDPPASLVPETVRLLQDAGIRLVMITGDQHETAEAVGRSLGILGAHGVAVDGGALERMSDADLAAVLPTLAVVSRATPEGKLRLVNAFAEAGDVVAMLGDGVNDAPALMRAHIGVSMGRRGTDVAKEASDIILLDDRFGTIAAAVEEGRVVFANIRRFVFYLFSCNVAELLALFIAGLTGMPLPMTPVQVLWMNVVTDAIAAMPLVFEPAEPGVMRAPPRRPGAPILSPRALWEGGAYSLAIAGVTLTALWYGGRGSATTAHAVTLSFMTLALAQTFHLANARGRYSVLTPRAALRNGYALAAVAVVLGLQVAAVHVAPLERVLGTVPLGAADWVVVIGLSLIPAVIGQGARLLVPGWPKHENSP